MSSLEEILNKANQENWAYHGSDRFKNYFFPNISKYFYVFENSNVLDVGCCCGIFSLAITQHAKKCIGVDHDQKYLNHFKKVKELTGENIFSYRSEIKDFAKNIDDYDFDSVFAANVLYHLDNETIRLIEEKILPKCEKVLFFSRENKPKRKNTYNLHSWKGIRDFLSKNGFKVDRLDGDKSIFKNYASDYKKGVNLVNRSVEISHTDSVLIPVFGIKK